jgi:hypothetical protein
MWPTSASRLAAIRQVLPNGSAFARVAFTGGSQGVSTQPQHSDVAAWP